MESTYTTKSGRHILIRPSRVSDATAAADFINTVSAEDTFLALSGEQYNLAEEEAYLNDCITRVQNGDMVQLHAFSEDTVIIGTVTVERNIQSKKRSRHVAALGLIVARDFRNDGLGTQLITCALQETKQTLSGVTLITLKCFADNIAGLALYRKMGFTRYGVLPRGLLRKGNYVDEILMIRQLV